MIRRHEARARSSRFVVWWALLLSQLLFACASASPEDGAPEGERLGQVAQALCTNQIKCGGNGENCCPENGDQCCGTDCIPAISAFFCCGSNVCNNGDFCADGQCCNTACNG